MSDTCIRPRWRPREGAYVGPERGNARRDEAGRTAPTAEPRAAGSCTSTGARVAAPPLEPVAVAATGAAARSLARRLLAREHTALAHLQGVCGDGVLVLLGEAQHLPWSDGAVYLGRDPEAPLLLLPTVLVPDVPLSWLERKLCAEFPEVEPPLALLPAVGLVLSVRAARRVEAAALRAWLAEPF